MPLNGYRALPRSAREQEGETTVAAIALRRETRRVSGDLRNRRIAQSGLRLDDQARGYGQVHQRPRRPSV